MLSKQSREALTLILGWRENGDMKKIILLFISVMGLSSVSLAEGTQGNEFTYDLGGGVGSYYDTSYTEIHVGVNWYVEDWLNWRNAVFTQFGSDINTVWGIDTALLPRTGLYTSGRSFGIELFAGPGLRFATQKSNAIFGEAGIVFTIAGLHIGGGVQALHYFATREDVQGRDLPSDETQLLLILSGSGTF